MGGVVCTVIFVSNQPVVLGCVGVGVLTTDNCKKSRGQITVAYINNMAGDNCSVTKSPEVSAIVYYSSVYLEGVGIPLVGTFGIIGNIVSVLVLRYFSFFILTYPSKYLVGLTKWLFDLSFT